MRKYVPVSLGLLFMVSNTSAEMLAQGFNLQYNVLHNQTYLGVSQNSLKKLDGDQWEYRAEVEPRGFASLFLSDRITEISRFTRSANTLIPTHYFHHHRKRDRDKQKYEISFDWDKKLLFNSSLNKHFDLADLTQDLLSFQLYLMQKLQQTPTLDSIAIPIAQRKAVHVYHLVNKGESKLVVPAGDYHVVHLESEAHDGDRYLLWFAKELEYLPVKFQKVDHDGDIVTLDLFSLGKKP